MLLENCPFPMDGRVRREAFTLTAAGHTVSVICPKARGEPYHETIGGVRVFRYPAPPAANGVFGYFVEYGYSLLAMGLLSVVVLFRVGFDTIHAHNPPDVLVFIGGFYKLLGKRFIFDHHDLSPEMYYARFGGEGSAFLFRALVFFERLSCKLADHVIATNESYKSIELERGGLTEDQITVVRNGPDFERIREVAPDEELRGRGQVIIGYVGVMGFQDGIDHLLRALQHLAHELGRTDFHAVLIGEGDAWASMKDLALKLDIEDHVRFTGRVPDADLIRLLCAADICVVPDPRNAFTDRSTMVKLLEYMALGKPVVAFDLTEHRVTGGEAALYAHANDDADFALQIQRLMDDPERREEMGRIGKARVESSLAWSHQEGKLLSVYSNARSGNVAGPRPAAVDD